ncbi:hypothetical protein BRC62_04610 [Halobacteriales archaeon QH_10_67_13]|nr:MAG: hypothetical protein BRC62_04610 [Halobacteriales archaeon QH_10_67_13]
MDDPLDGDAEDGDRIAGRFVVDEAGESAILRDVESERVFTLAEHPGFTPGEVVDGTLAPRRPLGIAYSVVSVAATRTIPVELSDQALTERARTTGTELAVGESARIELADGGEAHVVGVEPDRAEERAAELAKGSLRETAARLDAERVELRYDEAAGLVSVRYL